MIRKIFQHVLFILALSTVIGVCVNFSLLKRYSKGEFSQGFFSSEEYASIVFITLAEAEEIFSTGEAVFIDSRRVEAFLSGHILGALSIPFEEKEADLTQFPLMPENTVVVYCDGSECQSSVALAKVLHEQGFTDIRVLFGGWEEWVQEGLPVSSKNDQQ